MSNATCRKCGVTYSRPIHESGVCHPCRYPQLVYKPRHGSVLADLEHGIKAGEARMAARKEVRS